MVKEIALPEDRPLKIGTAWRKHLLNWLLIWSVPGVLLALWVYFAETNQLNHLFPKPEELVKTTLRFIKDGTLLENLQISFLRAAAGLLIGGSIGFLLGSRTEFGIFLGIQHIGLVAE